MSDPIGLPPLKIMVEPYAGLYNRWHYEVLRFKDGLSGEGWYPIRTGYRFLQGYARTKKRALQKARRAAADHCESLLSEAERQRRHESATTYENVICEEGL